MRSRRNDQISGGYEMRDLESVQTLEFSGQLLQRGFWLYIWRITYSSELFLYVGRTGDSSSANAASPFNRMGQHFDFREKAKGNAMMRNLRKEGIDPVRCNFELTAIGPLFAEQSTMEEHMPFRDKVAAMECALAKALRARRYTVLGSHGSRKGLDKELFDQIFARVEREFPDIGSV